MFETGRRSAISTSELGLYSDRGDRYNRNKYGPIVRKFVIVVMAVVAVILAAIFIYDFASGASATSKVSQETKHIYILQNSLKKPTTGLSKRQSTSTTITPDSNTNRSNAFPIQDRLDDADPRELTYVLANAPVPEKSKESRSARTVDGRPETRDQNLENLKHRKKLVERTDTNEEIPAVEGKQLFNNHAVVYRVRQRFQYPDPEDEVNEEESRPAPFHFELKTPQPTSFNKQRLKFPQLSQYRYPHASRNIQDIIKYLTNDPNIPNRGIKFTGVYVNPKKYDVFPEAGELMANSDRNEYQADGAQDEEDYDDDEHDDFSEASRYATVGNNGDPFYLYKPKHPTDVNLLAPSNVRFSPSGTHRYNPYHDPFFQRPPLNYVKPLPIPEVPQYADSAAAYSSGSYGQKRKPKPFSVMLDIYPITDLNDQPSNKVSRPRLPPASVEEYDPRRPLAYTRGQRYPPSKGHSIPLVAIPAGQTGLSEEEERQQMIFHLNLYPRKKNKHNRNDIIQRSESMRPEDHEKFMHSVMSPFDAITKHLTDHSAIEESKYEESELPETSDRPITENLPNASETQDEDNRYLQFDEHGSKNSDVSTSNAWNEEASENFPKSSNNQKETIPSINNDYPKEAGCKNCEGSQMTKNTKWSNLSTDIDTPEGFQAFADGLLASD